MTTLWEQLRNSDQKDQLTARLIRFRNEERWAGYPTPLCCLKSTQTPYAIELEPGQGLVWAIQHQDASVRVYHCPFCGESLPEFQKKACQPAHLRATDLVPCGVCCSSNGLCWCDYPENAWEAAGAPQMFAAMGLIWHPTKDKVLAVSRKNNPNDFGLPGGRLDPGETAEQCMRREIFEETGLVVTAAHLILDATDDHGHRCATFRVTGFEGEIQTQEAGVVAWLPIEQLTAPESSFRRFNQVLLERFGRV